jgi:hypothetical protein
MAPSGLPFDSFFAFKSHHRLEEVLVEPQPVAIKVVYQVNLFGSVIAQVSRRPADMGEVLLLDIGVVVLAIGPGTVEGHAIYTIQ